MLLVLLLHCRPEHFTKSVTPQTLNSSPPSTQRSRSASGCNLRATWSEAPRTASQPLFVFEWRKAHQSFGVTLTPDILYSPPPLTRQSRYDSGCNLNPCTLKANLYTLKVTINTTHRPVPQHRSESLSMPVDDSAREGTLNPDPCTLKANYTLKDTFDPNPLHSAVRAHQRGSRGTLRAAT